MSHTLLPKIPRTLGLLAAPSASASAPPTPRPRSADSHQLTELHDQQKGQSLHTDAQALEDIGVLQAPGGRGEVAGSGHSPFRRPLSHPSLPGEPKCRFDLFGLGFFTYSLPATPPLTPPPHAPSSPRVHLRAAPLSPQFPGQTPGPPSPSLSPLSLSPFPPHSLAGASFSSPRLSSQPPPSLPASGLSPAVCL